MTDLPVCGHKLDLGDGSALFCQMGYEVHDGDHLAVSRPPCSRCGSFGEHAEWCPSPPPVPTIMEVVVHFDSKGTYWLMRR